MAKCTKCAVGSLGPKGHRSDWSKWRNLLRLPREEVGSFDLEVTVRHPLGRVVVRGVAGQRDPGSWRGAAGRLLCLGTLEWSCGWNIGDWIGVWEAGWDQVVKAMGDLLCSGVLEGVGVCWKISNEYMIKIIFACSENFSGWRIAWESLANHTSPKDSDLVLAASELGFIFLRSHLCHPDEHPGLGTWQNQVFGSGGSEGI